MKWLNFINSWYLALEKNSIVVKEIGLNAEPDLLKTLWRDGDYF